ncbi:MAG TPA: hypothetical protein VK101_09835 [Limnochordia bacterium]|nr:hypothetical protein [Limnochordia bacterium]
MQINIEVKVSDKGLYPGIIDGKSFPAPQLVLILSKPRDNVIAEANSNKQLGLTDG